MKKGTKLSELDQAAVDMVQSMLDGHKKGMHTPLLIDAFLAGMSYVDPKARIQIKVTYPR